jgi:citrate lyase subunit beta/citryl-CoA lyase
MIVLRSMIFVPGNSMRMITKAATLSSDAIILDLEDAVPLPDKVTARIMIRDCIKPIKLRGYHVVVRINALATDLTEEDLKTVVTKDLDSVMLAKTESVEDVKKLHLMLGNYELKAGVNKGKIGIIPLIESTKGVVNV